MDHDTSGVERTRLRAGVHRPSRERGDLNRCRRPKVGNRLIGPRHLGPKTIVFFGDSRRSTKSLGHAVIRLCDAGRVDGLRRPGKPSRSGDRPASSPLTRFRGGSPSKIAADLLGGLGPQLDEPLDAIEGRVRGQDDLRGWSRSRGSSSGSRSKTSIPAPRRWPDSRASINASWSTTGPRAVLIRTEPGRIRASARASIKYGESVRRGSNEG